MAPLTRTRAQETTISARALNVEHYNQRATEGGSIIAEASQISQTGQGYPATPGIYSEKQVGGWRDVTDAVHLKGGRIFLLWHVGRVSHSSIAFDVSTKRSFACSSLGDPDQWRNLDGVLEVSALRNSAGTRSRRDRPGC